MAQLGFLNIFIQVIILLIIFFILYYLIYKFFIPQLLLIINYRYFFFSFLSKSVHCFKIIYNKVDLIIKKIFLYLITFDTFKKMYQKLLSIKKFFL